MKKKQFTNEKKTIFKLKKKQFSNLKKSILNRYSNFHFSKKETPQKMFFHFSLSTQ